MQTDKKDISNRELPEKLELIEAYGIKGEPAAFISMDDKSIEIDGGIIATLDKTPFCKEVAAALVHRYNQHTVLVEALKLARMCLKDLAGEAWEMTSAKVDIEQALQTAGYNCGYNDPIISHILIAPEDESGNDDGILDRRNMTAYEASERNEQLYKKQTGTHWVKAAQSR